MSSTSAAGETAQWLQHVSQVQVERMTPEMRREQQERAERQRRSEMRRRTSVSMESHSCRSRSLLGEGLRQMSVSASVVERSATQSRWQSAQLASSQRSSATIRGFEAASLADVSFVWRDEDADAEGVAESAALVGAQDAAAIGAEASAQDLEPLLQQLRVEPEDADEVAAKFGMYETYAQEVERLRSDLFAFHESHRESLPPAVAREMDGQLRAVDSQERMGIPDDTRVWFVYHMMKQAERNNKSMIVALRVYNRKLELLAKREQSDCPVCLEPFGDERPAETLGCCHAVCQECWQHWTSVMHGRPFCPVCRHDAFLGFITSQDAPVLHTIPSDVGWDEQPFHLLPLRHRAPARQWPRLDAFRGIISALMPWRCCPHVFSWRRSVQHRD